MQADIMVIGAGSVGLAAGYQLARRGARVVLLDEGAPPHALGSHHGSTRLIRYAYGEGARYVPLLLRARRLWQELEAESGEPLLLPCGVLNLGRADSPFIHQVAASAREYGLALEQVARDEIARRWPAWQLPAGLAGAFEPEAGVLYCERALLAWRRLAERAGARLLEHSAVRALSMDSKGGVTASTAQGEIRASKALLCAGQHTVTLLAGLGLSLPLTRVRKTFAWYRADEKAMGPGCFPGFSADLAEGIYYGFPTLDGAGFKLGRHDGGQPLAPGEPLAPFGAFEEDRAELDAVVRAYLPGVGELIEGKACHYIRTPDEDFILDRHPEHERLFFASACSGHGFKFAAVLGELFAHWMLDGDPGFDLAPFRLARFG
ncbi:N-methyltryptophan oxidase [Zobellella denitrificans]|uniref:N-methyltryptophan oxidase n=1 Tax=Zobellella denitrificans TaxID=347534 RepID=A0A291HQ87_9GAMM|nr:N-methyl-L-tryptophan oxidase [Zobellella denitrificans]ATG74305.1 N-methyltryptophan oxidase [Zobellella denitrificans]